MIINSAIEKFVLITTGTVVRAIDFNLKKSYFS